MGTAKDSIDLLFTFDTTGSMYTCIAQVRRDISATAKRLFKDIPNLRIGVIAHGDYCDGPRAITKLDFSDDVNTVCRFVETVRDTSGGDEPECYELVLHEARSFSWTSGKNKAVVMIGDATPHGPHERQNTKKLDWRNELKLLCEAGIHVHAVQALGRSHATAFWKECASITGGHHLELHQFSHVTDLIHAICYNQVSQDQVKSYEQEVSKRGRMDRSLHQIFSTLLGRAAAEVKTAGYGKASLEAVHPSRFQVLRVDKKADIQQFVGDNGVKFKAGRGFYELTKSVKVQDHKEVILRDRKTGDMFSGAKAREMLRLPKTGTVSINPKVVQDVLTKYSAFIQSTSFNRVLMPDTDFLYENAD